MKTRIKIQGYIIFLTVIVSIFLSKLLFPHWTTEPLDEFLDVLGMVMVLFGFLTRIVARGYKAEKSYGGTKLITGGPYSLVQHPMYFGTLLIGTGIILVLFKLWILILFLLVFLLIYIPQIHREQKKLYRCFGDEYKQYYQVTPKYFPSSLNLFKVNFGDYIFLKWSWIKKELPSAICTVAVLIAIEVWQDIKLFGHAELTKEFLELSLVVIIFVFIIFVIKKKNVL